MYKHLLVPLDGSRLAEAALPAAFGLARKLNADVTLLHVIERRAPILQGSRVPLPMQPSAARRE